MSTADFDAVVQAEPAETAPPLPPAGDARREEYRRRLDELQQQCDEVCAQMELEGIDPSKLRIVREVAQRAHDEDLAVSNAQPEYCYAWVYRDPFNRFGNRVFHSMQRLGWEAVVGDMPEAREQARGPGGERFNADCLLVRIRRDRHEAIEQHQRLQRIAREQGITADLVERAQRAGTTAHVDGLPSGVQSQIVSASAAQMNDRALRRANARRLAIGKMDSHLRAGTMPGMRVGR